MNNYQFETREFGVSEKGIHLLRSRFNYKTIGINEIDSLTIERGKELNNWAAILIIGLALVSFSIYYSLRLFDIIGGNEVNRIYIEEILVPVIPLMLGGYCLYSSTRNGNILRIRTTTNKTHRLLLTELEKENRLKAFQDFLKQELKVKARVNV